MIRSAVLFACCIALAALVSAAPAGAFEIVTDSLAMDWSRVPEYRIVPGDKLVIDMGPRPDAISNVRSEQLVRPDGRITVYPVGDVVAAGLTPMELQRSVTSLLAADLRAPRITVELAATASSLVHVIGRVERAGPIPAGPFMTVSQAIAAAGGFKDDAARNSVVVIHRDGARSVRVARVRMDRVLKGEDLQDLALSRFDIVFVPRSSIGNMNVFLRQMFEPLAPVMSTAFTGWELFNLDRVFVTRVVKE